MSEDKTRSGENSEDLLKDFEQGTEITELEEGDLEDVAGGSLQVPQDNTNCGNTQCCG